MSFCEGGKQKVENMKTKKKENIKEEWRNIESREYEN